MNALAILLKVSEPEIRSAASQAIEAIGPPAAGAVPTLITCLQDKDAMVQEHAILALGAIGPKAKDAVPHLVALLDSVKGWHESPARALGRIGRPAVPALLERLRRREKKAGCDAEEALVEMGPAVADLVVPSLLEILRDRSQRIDWPLLRVLTAMKPNPREAIPVLSEALPRSNANRPWVLEALARLGPEAAPVLADELNKDQSHVLWALRIMGRDGKAAAAELRRLMQTPLTDSYLRFEVAPVLAIVDPDRVGELQPVALEMLDFPAPNFKQQGMIIVGQIHKAAPTAETKERIRMALSSDQLDLLVPALEALGEIGPKARGSVRDLAPLLGHESYSVREHAAKALNRILADPASRQVLSR